MPKPRTISVPLYDGDDFERITELRREVEIAERQSLIAQATARAGDDHGSDVQAAKDAYDDFVREAAERAEVWILQPIGRTEYRALIREHGPRETEKDGESVVDPEDAAFGVNVDTFPLALLAFVDDEDDEIRTVVEPEFDSLAALRKRLKRLSAGEMDTLWIRAKSLNEGLVRDPKADLFSTGTPRSDET